MFSVFRSRILLSAALIVSLAGPTLAQAQALTVGSRNVATADPLVPRPPTTPCTVTLFTGQQFADFNNKPFDYTPAAGCAGPWEKVVLAVDFSITGTRQYDRTARIWLGNSVIYFGTTQEPSIPGGGTTSWHVERDLTDYSALLSQTQNGYAELGNFVGTYNGVVYDGVITGTATLYFYPGGDGNESKRPDQVLSLNQSGGIASLAQSSDQLSASFSALPKNIERAYLDVYTQSQGSDEFWYFDLPNDIAPLFQDTGNTAFKEALVTIDGQPAGISPIYPWIYTGGADPILWRPIPGVQTLAFEPYRVDLTPFVGVLGDGSTHSVAISVYNAADHFATAANLLLYLDAGAATVTGSVTTNTLSATPVVDVVENVTTAADGSASGSVSVTSNRSYTIAGTANTSHGAVTTQIDSKIGFSSVQQLATSNTVYQQDTVQRTDIDTLTTRTQNQGNGKGKGSAKSTTLHEQRSYPLTFNYDYVTAADGSATLHSAVDQEFQQKIDAGVSGNAIKTATRDNHVVTTVTRNYDASGALVSTPATASQTYPYADPFGACYSRKIEAQDRILTAVTDGSGCPGGQNVLSWHDQFAKFVSDAWGATVKLLP